MSSSLRYIRPASLKEALDFLARNGSSTALLAGGTDLMIAVRRGDIAGEFVLDVSRLEELRSIETRSGSLWVGSAVTYTEIMSNPAISEHAPVLALAARCVGSVQIRNKGTLGGNVANASPAADSVAPMVVHNARVFVESAAGSRTPRLEEVIVAPYRTSLRHDELITGFLLEPLSSGYRCSFQRIARRRALSIARINTAAVGQLDEHGAVKDLRLCVGSVLPQPCRMTAAEELVVGQVPDTALIQDAVRRVSAEMVRRSGVRSSTEYKRPAVEGLVTKALNEVLLEGPYHG